MGRQGSWPPSACLKVAIIAPRDEPYEFGRTDLNACSQQAHHAELFGPGTRVTVVRGHGSQF